MKNALLITVLLLVGCSGEEDDATNTTVINDCSNQVRSGLELAEDVAEGEEVEGDFEPLMEKKYYIDTCGSGTIVISEETESYAGSIQTTLTDREEVLEDQ